MLTARSSNPIRLFSFGGGVQSTAVMVLQAERGLFDYDAFVFANVGEDSENPATLEFVNTHMKPYAAAHGLRFVELRKTTYGKPETLLAYMDRTKRSIPIPARMGGNGAPGNRACTADFKIAVVDKWTKAEGYTHATVGLGISLDEFHRARDTQWHDAQGKKKFGFTKKREYPLIQLRLRRADCQQIIAHAGLPTPPKSSCWFCPFHRPGEWIEMKREDPDLFQAAVELERRLWNKRELLGRDRLFLHPSLRPLDQAVGDQLPMFPDWEMDFCESGYCMV